MTVCWQGPAGFAGLRTTYHLWLAPNTADDLMGEAESNTASTAAVRDAVTEFTFWLDQLDQIEA